ncbi:hypothetical protein [Chitinilyticum litopenaei]|uniref:hypothetical protein n=1 Tax=Chitinilyticum litopenaei TaxID=1121276 RepID=UPI00130E8AEF|nr:hypothetical protein [Chitinilyticum litopenaei]
MKSLVMPLRQMRHSRASGNPECHVNSSFALDARLREHDNKSVSNLRLNSCATGFFKKQKSVF